jgi:Predicted HD superfamily hydrolase involved in NAD metabolism
MSGISAEQKKMLNGVREKVKDYLTAKRYAHTLETEKEAANLGGMFFTGDDCADKIFKLRLSALLHDITKNYTIEKQLKCCEKFGIIVNADDLYAPKIFHAKTAAEVARDEFTEFGDVTADDEVIAGIRWHTTGRAGMTLFESLVYMADYIEPSRDFEGCITLRRYFYDNPPAKNGAPYAEKLRHLRNTMIMSYDMTIKNLISENSVIDADTISARNYFIIGGAEAWWE